MLADENLQHAGVVGYMLLGMLKQQQANANSHKAFGIFALPCASAAVVCSGFLLLFLLEKGPCCLEGHLAFQDSGLGILCTGLVVFVMLFRKLYHQTLLVLRIVAVASCNIASGCS